MSQLNSSNYSETLCAKLFFGPNNKGKINFREIQDFRLKHNLQNLTDEQMSDYILLLFLVIFGFSDLLLFDNTNPLYPYNNILFSSILTNHQVLENYYQYRQTKFYNNAFYIPSTNGW